jgi:hypothetical protein
MLALLALPTEPIRSTDDSRRTVVGEIIFRRTRRFTPGAGQHLRRSCLPLAHTNRDELVAAGAVVQIGLLTRNGVLAERVVTEIAPCSFGVGVRDAHRDRVRR